MSELLKTILSDHRVKDGGIVVGTGTYFITALAKIPTLAQCVGAATLTLTILRILEILTGKKISELIRRKNNKN